jgi:hypothetical protein
MTGQPDFCNRCGDRLDPNGIPCYQKHCNYKKYSDDADADDDNYDDDDGFSLEINNQDTGSTDNSYWRKKIFNRDKEVESTESDDSSDGNDSDSTDSGDSDSSSSGGSDNGGCLDFDGLGDGCIGGFLKIIWKIISFPFRVILWIGEIFD